MQYPKQTDNYDVDIFNSNFQELSRNVISLDTTKFDKTEAQGLFKDVSFNRSNGVITFILYDGSTKTIDTLLEKLAVNFDFDPETQRLIIILDDGTEKYVDLSAFITQYEFLDSETIIFVLGEDGKVSAKIKEGSIEEKHLRPDYLADIKVEAAKVEASATATAEYKQAAEDAEASALEKALHAAQSAEESTRQAESANASAATAMQAKESAASSAIEAESYAHGGTGTREGEDTDNAMEYARQAKETAESIDLDNFIMKSEKGAAGGIAELDDNGKIPEEQIPSIANESYSNLENKPKINGVELDGNKLPSELGLVPFTTTSDLGLNNAKNAIGYVYGTSEIYGPSDGAIFEQAFSDAWSQQIYGDYRTGQIATRGKNNGTWQTWRRQLDDQNYTLLAKAFGPQIHYGTTAQPSGFYKIKILDTSNWMLSFTVRLYQNYAATDILICGYNYGENHWFLPNASLIDAINKSSVVVQFGYDSDGYVWVAIPADIYTGLTICNINNGYRQVEDWSDKFQIENVSSITGTVQKSVTVSAPTKSSTIRQIEKVSALPSDAASHADTLYVITG